MTGSDSLAKLLRMPHRAPQRKLPAREPEAFCSGACDVDPQPGLSLLALATHLCFNLGRILLTSISDSVWRSSDRATPQAVSRDVWEQAGGRWRYLDGLTPSGEPEVRPGHLLSKTANGISAAIYRSFSASPAEGVSSGAGGSLFTKPRDLPARKIGPVGTEDRMLRPWRICLPNDAPCRAAFRPTIAALKKKAARDDAANPASRLLKPQPSVPVSKTSRRWVRRSEQCGGHLGIFKGAATSQRSKAPFQDCLA